MRKYKKIVILTGAGISAESGIKTFRDVNGLWQSHRIEEVASPEGFAAMPEKVHEFYNMRRRQILSDEVAANAAHVALAKLQNEFDGEVTLVTQNVDDLHERGGSTDVLHMHGELLKKRCSHCKSVSPCREDIDTSIVCSDCGQDQGLRPHIVWFGEMPFCMDQAQSALLECDLFISIGTSGHVYPAAGFVSVASQVDAETICLNLEASANSGVFTQCEHGLATEIVPAFVEMLLT